MFDKGLTVEGRFRKTEATAKTVVPETRRRMRGRFDAASSTDETRRHWANADSLAADAAADPAIRAILRSRARYERFNNPFMCGQLRTLANDVIGVGPAMQLLTPNETVNTAVEGRFDEWANAIGLARKLRMARQVRAADGEVFLRLVFNPRIQDPVKLDLMLIEGDQCRTPSLMPATTATDGIELDEFGNPAFYWFSRTHPGARDTLLSFGPSDFIRVPAADIIHYLLVERPGQHRGIPEIVSSLNLHAERRGYRQSVLTAARAVAALGAVILKTENSSNPDEELAPFDTIELEHGMMTVAPDNATPFQVRPEQPSANYKELMEQLITEQARPLNMPRNVAAGDSSNYNFASGRLDHQTYDRSNKIDQKDLADIVLRPIVQAWAVAATAIPRHLPGRAGQIYLPTRADPNLLVPVVWIWGERDHVDPAKEANATKTRLETGMTTRAAEYARTRRDWRTETTQAGREREALNDAGLYTLDPRLAPQVQDALRNVGRLGAEASIELLVLLGVPRETAETMVAQVTIVVPLATDDSVPPSGNNGNGAAARRRASVPMRNL